MRVAAQRYPMRAQLARSFSTHGGSMMGMPPQQQQPRHLMQGTQRPVSLWDNQPPLTQVSKHMGEIRRESTNLDDSISKHRSVVLQQYSVGQFPVGESSARRHSDFDDADEHGQFPVPKGNKF